MTAPCAPAPARATRTLWLVRHGESTWNALGLCQGQLGGPKLTARGRRQAHRCARALAGEPIGLLVTSDLRRAMETSVPIAGVLGLTPTADLRLRERSLGTAEGRPSGLLGPEQSGVAGGKVVDPDAAPAGGESVRQLYDRVVACTSERLRQGDGDLALVCHGGVVRVLLAWLAGDGPEAMAWPEVHNALPSRWVATVPPSAL
jgi:2,3-bisphosphoglycerate-dependent phosphoglycerate mutase